MQSKTIKKDQPGYSLLFSICSIVTNENEYNKAKSSFEACGFIDNCEYLVADNISANQFSAYEAIACFLKQSSARYLIIIHQDVRCLDHKETLADCLDNLAQLDDKWAVCGNAGSLGYHEQRFYLHNAGKEIITEGLPARVTCLDENLLIINRETNLTLSADLPGFHFYGCDLCLVADFLGYTCYVIPFMVEHLSLGNLEELRSHQAAFISQYGRKLRNRFIETTCTKFYLSNAAWKNKLFNTPFIFPLIKLWHRILFSCRHIFLKKTHFKTVKRKTGAYKELA